MNPFLTELLAMLFRQGAIYVAGWIGASALAAQHMPQIQQYSMSAAVFVLAVAYAAYKKYVAKQVTLTALASTRPMSEADAKALVKNPMVTTPSVTTPKDEIPW